MKEIINLCEVQIDGDITGSVEGIIEFFEDFKNSYDTLLKDVFPLTLESKAIEQLCLAEPNDSPIKIYPKKNEDDVWKNFDYDFELLKVQFFDEEKRKTLDKKLDSLIDNHSLMITKLNYNSKGFLKFLGDTRVIKIIVDFVNTIINKNKVAAETKKFEAETVKTNAETKKIEAETEKTKAETEKIRAETEKIKNEVETTQLVQFEEKSPLFCIVIGLETFNELFSPKVISENKAYIDMIANDIANRLELINKHIALGRITNATIQQ